MASRTLRTIYSRIFDEVQLEMEIDIWRRPPRSDHLPQAFGRFGRSISTSLTPVQLQDEIDICRRMSKNPRMGRGGNRTVTMQHGRLVSVKDGAQTPETERRRLAIRQAAATGTAPRAPPCVAATPCYFLLLTGGAFITACSAIY